MSTFVIYDNVFALIATNEEQIKEAISIRGNKGASFNSSHPQRMNRIRIMCVNEMAKKTKMEISIISEVLTSLGLSTYDDRMTRAVYKNHPPN